MSAPLQLVPLCFDGGFLHCAEAFWVEGAPLAYCCPWTQAPSPAVTESVGLLVVCLAVYGDGCSLKEANKNSGRQSKH